MNDNKLTRQGSEDEPNVPDYADLRGARDSEGDPITCDDVNPDESTFTLDPADPRWIPHDDRCADANFLAFFNAKDYNTDDLLSNGVLCDALWTEYKNEPTTQLNIYPLTDTL